MNLKRSRSVYGFLHFSSWRLNIGTASSMASVISAVPQASHVYCSCRVISFPQFGHLMVSHREYIFFFVLDMIFNLI
ncbi:MAG: hypothetical protein ACTSU9_01660 [Promethearchaeota archaeon]